MNAADLVDWLSILERAPGIVLGLDGERRIAFLAGKGRGKLDAFASRPEGMRFEDYLARFRSARLLRDDAGRLKHIEIGDDRLPHGRAEIQVLGDQSFEGGGRILFLEDVTGRRIIENFMDYFHDVVEADLLERAKVKCAFLENLTHTLVASLETANLYSDQETGKHILRVSAYSALTARLIGFDEAFVSRIRQYSSLHDIGKVGIPDVILKKPGTLTKAERTKMMRHVVIGGRLLGHPEIDPMARNIALFHHEKWDGSGYAKGLAGEGIPIEARIVSVADVYDALRTYRVYKEAFSRDRAAEVIRSGSGTHFDPAVVSVFSENEEKYDEACT